MDQPDLNERFQRRIKGTFTEFLGMRLLEVGQGHVVGERVKDKVPDTFFGRQASLPEPSPP